MNVNVALLSIKELEIRGQGIPRYINELYDKARKLGYNSGIDIEKVYLNHYYKTIGDALSFELDYILYKKNLEKYDIIHLPNGFFMTHRLPKNKKYLVTIHDAKPIPVQTNNLNYLIKDKLWRYIALKRGIENNIKLADKIIVDSTQTKEEVTELGKDKKDIVVINLGVDKRFREERITNNKKSFVVGYMGSFATNKNVRFAIKSFKFLEGKMKFELWGEKTYNYKSLFNSATADKRIIFKGFAPENEIVNIYDSFDIFVFPTLYEGFGIPIFEAQSRSLPVIVYKYGKIPKEVKKYCFEAKDPEHMAQIITNLKENGYNDKLKKKATEYARSFTWEKTAKETIAVYEKVYNN